MESSKEKEIRDEMIKGFKALIAFEILIAQKEGEKTSRLTSLWNKLK